MTVVTGRNFRRNLLFLKVTLPEPSTFTLYWSCAPTSTTIPVRSHFLEWWPSWFWMNTWSPTLRGVRALLCKLSLSCDRRKRALRASSFADHASLHVDRMWGLSNLGRRLTNEKESLICLPKIISAGEILQSGSGVFLTCRRARKRRSLLRDPDGPIFSRRRRLHFLTATSARPLDWGKWDEDNRCRTPQRLRKLSVLVLVNSGPPSLEISSGTPKVAKRDLNAEIRPSDPDCGVLCAAFYISVQPDSRSPAIR